MIALPFTELGQLAALVQDTFCLRRGGTLSVGGKHIGAVQGDYAVVQKSALLGAGSVQAIRRNGGSCWPIQDSLAGLYQDTAGTLPVTTQGQVIGLSLDQSYGSANLGGELVGNTGGPFASLTGWAAASSPSGSSIQLSNGEIVVTSTQAGGHGEYYMTGLVVGRRYQLSGAVRGGTSRVQLNFVAGASGGYGTVGQSGTVAVGTSSAISLSFVATSTDGYVVPNNMDIGTSYLLSASVKEVLGVHLTQSTGANKPTLTRVPKKLGPERTTNGDFSAGTTSWSVFNGTHSVVSGELQSVTTVAGGGSWQDYTLDANKTYLVTGTARKTSSTTAMLVAQRGAAGSYAYLNQALLNATATNVYYTITPTGSDVQIKLTSSTGADTLYADNISVREVLEWSNAYLFDGSNDTLTFTPPAITTAATLGWAGTISDLSAGRVLFGQENVATRSAQAVVETDGSIKFSNYVDQAFATPAGYASTNTPIVITMQIAVGGTSVIRRNGVQVATSTAITTALAGVLMWLNSRGGVSFTPGTVSDVVIENSVIPLADLKAWERNACNQLGIAYAG